MKKKYPILVSILFFTLALFFYSRNLSFAFFYHPDEINKVIQILQDERNFHHPLLMLNTAGVIHRLAGAPQDMQRTVELGRWVSVIFASATVGLLAFAAWMLAGEVAQVICGLLVLSEPTLFEFAHYLKEDPTLIMAMSAVIVVLLAYERRPTAMGVILIGIASGLSVSAKYIGVTYSLVALGAVFMILRKENRSFRQHIAYFAIAMIATILVVNWQFIFEVSHFRKGLGSEVELFEKSEQHLPNKRMFDLIVKHVEILGALAICFWVASPWLRGRKLTIGEWTVFVIAALYSLLLLLSTRASSRYVVPVTMCMALMIPVGWTWLGEGVAGKFGLSKKWLGGICCALAGIGVLTPQAPEILEVMQGFQSDSRLQAVSFLRSHLPAGSVLAESSRALLPDAARKSRNLPGWNLPFKRVISPDEWPWLHFTIEELRAQGVTHIVLTEIHKPDKRDASEAIFFQKLSTESKLVYFSPKSIPPYLHPELSVYELTREP